MNNKNNKFLIKITKKNVNQKPDDEKYAPC